MNVCQTGTCAASAWGAGRTSGALATIAPCKRQFTNVGNKQRAKLRPPWRRINTPEVPAGPTAPGGPGGPAGPLSDAPGVPAGPGGPAGPAAPVRPVGPSGPESNKQPFYRQEDKDVQRRSTCEPCKCNVAYRQRPQRPQPLLK